jgi:hypothetical protein
MRNHTSTSVLVPRFNVWLMCTLVRINRHLFHSSTHVVEANDIVDPSLALWTSFGKPVYEICLNLVILIIRCLTPHRMPVLVSVEVGDRLQWITSRVHQRAFVLVPKTALKDAITCPLGAELGPQASVVLKHIRVAATSVTLIIPRRGVFLARRRRYAPAR